MQDVSDRIEKEPDESPLLNALQKDSIPVVRGDWKVHIGSELQEGTVKSCTLGHRQHVGILTKDSSFNSIVC